MGLRYFHFFAVCDGHGQQGREVSNLLKHRLPFYVDNNCKTYVRGDAYPMLSDMDRVFQLSFAEANRELHQSGIDIRFR